MVKKSVVAVLCAVCALSASAEDRYGDCNLLIQLIKSSAYRKQQGWSIQRVYQTLDRLTANSWAGRDATPDERNTWRRLAGYEYDRPGNVSDEYIATELGRFCRDYPYRLRTREDFLREAEDRRAWESTRQSR